VFKYLPFAENLLKIGPVDPEIIDLKKSLKKKEINASRTYIACGAGMRRGLKTFWHPNE